MGTKKYLEKYEKRKKEDKIILIVFFICEFLILPILLFGYTQNTEETLVGLINNIFASFIITFFITGLVAFYYRRKTRKKRTRNVLKWFLIIGAIVSLILTLLYNLYLEDYIYIEFTPDIMSLNLIIATYLVLLLTILVVIIIYFIVGFGFIGVLSAIERIFVPDILFSIKQITNRSKENKNIETKIIQWIFNVPYVLDTGKLKLSVQNSKEFPWHLYRIVIIWEVFFSIIIAVNIGLNPFLLELGTLGDVFALTGTISTFIPILVLPWFVFRRLNARIPGITSDFRLYDGLKLRVFQFFVAVGTLIIFIRLAIKEIRIANILSGIFTYIISFIVIVGIFTFIYFNYYERDLIKDIYLAYRLK